MNASPSRAPRARSVLASGLLAMITVSPLSAQTNPNAPAATASEEKAIELSPFEVLTSQDRGYTATHTLAGSRLNTSLRDTPAAISIFTKEFLEDIGALNVASVLDYALGAAPDNSDFTGNVIMGNDLIYQMRGFVGASLGRNYFSWSLSSDSFNVERIDFSRGPNSILFGIGGPGGITNTTTKRARIGAAIHEFRARLGSWDDYRFTVDWGQTLIDKKLAIRLNLLRQEKESWREFEESARSGAALALTFRPFRNTEIRFDGERGVVDQVQVHPWPAQERFYAWRNAGSLISPTFGAAVAGTGRDSSRFMIYDPFGGLGPISYFNARTSNQGPGAPSLGNNSAAITDTSILPNGASVSGPGYTGDFDYYSYALFLEQRIGDFTVEVAFNERNEQRENFRPQGFAEVALNVDVNAQLPNGQPNPNVGKFYTAGQTQMGLRDTTDKEYRVTASYNLDLTKRSKWLGRYTFAALLTRRDSFDNADGLDEVNLTPAGTSIYPADLTSANNRIGRRTYLDFTSGNPRLRGMHYPRLYPIVNQNGVNSGFVRTRDASRDDLARTDTRMIALQAKLFGELLTFTGGLRNDRERVWGSTSDLNGSGSNADDRDPVTRLFPQRIRNATSINTEGDTRTYGVVFRAASWLSLSYNSANNFIPQNSLDINENSLGNRRGEGEDFGFRVFLFEDKISGSVFYFKTRDANRSIARDNAFINSINAIWDTLGRPEDNVSTGSRDSQDLNGDGYEFDFTANPTSQWRLSLNFTIIDQITSNIQPRNGAYVEANRALWRQNGATPLIAGAAGVPTTDPVAGGPATISTAIRTIDDLYAGFKQGEGNIRRQLRKYSGNLFTSYTFKGNGIFNGLTAGMGLQYRGKEVVGYDSTRNNAPIWGNEYTLLNGMLGYNFKLGNKPRLRIQLNVDNILDEDDLLALDQDQTQVWRVKYQTPRRFGLQAIYTF